ncbi:16827_t:CDS:10, partial [Cetraspora pellucida]
SENDEYNVMYDHYAVEIIPRLYLGSYLAAEDEDWLGRHKITNILTVSQDIKPRFPELFTYKVIPIRDSELQDISKYFEETYMFIQNVLDQEDKTILVHCEMGISRSPTVVIAYIMRSQKKSLKDALAFVKEKRFVTRDFENEDYVMHLSSKNLTNGVKPYESKVRFNEDFAVEIIPRLYKAAKNEDWLRNHKITDILTVAQNIRPRFPKSFTYKVISIRDSEVQDISKYFEETYMFIQNVLDQEDKSVLVHCEMGISRSPTVVIAYIMRSQKKSLKDALAFVKEKRFVTRPNAGFYKQLKNFESGLLVDIDLDSESELTNK